MYKLEELQKNIYLMGLPLPNNPLKEINIYIIKGGDGEKSMIIDTGFNRQESKDAFEFAFKELGLSPENTILFLTHLHSDHTGLAGYFADMGMEVYASELDADILNNSLKKEDSKWMDTVRLAHMQGLDEDELDIEDHPGYKYRPIGHVDYRIVRPGDVFKIGGYSLQVLDFKGHTPGLVGLYDRAEKVLFCGDHILKKITPNITLWGYEYGDSLGIYFDSLEYAYSLEVKHLYSSHRALVEDHRARIDEIRLHHKKRLDEAREALRKSGKSTVRSVTKQMHWDISSRNWDEFPKSQKWFAAGEAHAHLEHLYAIGEVGREEEEGVLYYYLLDNK